MNEAVPTLANTATFDGWSDCQERDEEETIIDSVLLTG